MASTSNSNEFFGWDLLYKTVESKISQKSDILIALAHFMLIKQSNFRCVGIGEDKTITDDEGGSELLPDGWNDDANKYSLRYAYNKELYLLFGQKTEDCIIINLLNVKTKKVSNIALEPGLMVKETKGSIYQLMPTASLLADRIRKELITPVFTGTTKEVTTQTTTPQQRSDPLRISEPMRPLGQFLPVGVEPRPFGFPDVGRGDLDPLGRGGPGNLLPFPSRPDFRAGLQPRFDPFGPPEPNVRPNPNPDHLQPPNFGHDYYM